MALRRFEEAVSSYGMAIALRPGFVDTYLGRANALRELGRLEEALGS
jgi:tetratricopeptide (TPR) repeat protein